MTSSERMLWEKLKNRKLEGYKFRRQHPLGFYIADFYCHEKRLVVEVDGGIHNKPDNSENDKNRTAELDRFGVTVIRFSNKEVTTNLQDVLQKITHFLKEENHNSPSP